MRIAILADIHGNLPALEAVLADLEKQAPDAVYLGGDQINRCPWNNEVLDLLHDLRWPAILGNHEIILRRLNTSENRPPYTDRQLFPTLWWTMEQLSDANLRSLQTLPDDLAITLPDTPPIRLIHGRPNNPYLGLFEQSSDAELLEQTASVKEETIACGHTHQPMVRCIESAERTVRIYNGGSVGLPYNGDPRAQYLLLDLEESRQRAVKQWMPTLRRIDYDHSVVEEAFHTSGMYDAIGPLAELHLRTVLTGHPWTSDFGYWIRSQSAEMKADLGTAIECYLQKYGPGHWAFVAG